MRHVVFCVQNLSVPTDTRVWREARSLAQAGYRVSVVCPRSTGEKSRESSCGVHIRRYGSAMSRGGLSGHLVETVVALVKTAFIVFGIRVRGHIDVIHAANPPDTFFLLARLLRPLGTIYVYDQHDLVPELFDARSTAGGVRMSSRLVRRVFSALEWCSYRTAEMIVVPNESYRSIAIRRGRVDANRIVVVRSGPDAVASSTAGSTDDTSASSPAATARSEHPHPATSGDGMTTVVFAGTMGPQDGVITLIEAFARLSDETRRRCRLEMIGEGSERPLLRARVDELGVSGFVDWLGWVEQDELARRLARATVAVSPDPDTEFSRCSTMTKIAEYLAAGLPCVVADLTENVATARDAASYYRAGDVEDMATVMEQVIVDTGLQHDLRRRAAIRARHLTWSNGERALLTGYRALMDSAVPGPIERSATGSERIRSRPANVGTS